MKRIKNLLRNLIHFCRNVRLMFRFMGESSKWINQESYFPEKRTKNKTRIYWDFVCHILKYGEIDKFYFAYGFDGKPKSEMNKYIAYSSFMDIRNSRNYSHPYSYVCLLRNKRLFDMFGKAIGMPIVSSSGVMNTGVISIDGKQIDFPLFLQANPNLFVKSATGECGEGVYSVKAESTGKMLLNNDKVVSTDYFKSVQGDFVVQPLLQQHDQMNKLYPNSVNTLRIVTITDLKTGEPTILASLLRIGTNGHAVDNWAKGGIAVGVKADGYLKAQGFYKPGFGTLCSVHPNTGVELGKFKVPYFEEAKELCKKFHKEVGVHSIGWDVAITNDGPVFIEGNDNWEITLMEMGCEPLKEKFVNYCKD